MRPRGVKRLFAFPFRRRTDVRADVGEEFAFHLDMRTEALQHQGLTAADARAQALREFGDVSRGAAACVHEGGRVDRRHRRGRYIDELRQDVTVAWRSFSRSPGFSMTAILMLALGIGATASIFSGLDAVLFRPLAYPNPDRLVQVHETLANGSANSTSGGAFLDWRRHNTQFTALALLNRITRNLRTADEPARVRGLEASHELLDVLGVAPILGRGFLPPDDQPGGANHVVLLTEELWRSRFGADPGLVNRAIVLDNVPHTVIGILPRGAWLFAEDLFIVPAVLPPGSARAARSPHWAVVFGRLKPGAAMTAADAELKTIKRQLEAEYPPFKAEWSVAVQSMTELLAAGSRPALYILLGAVSLVLLIACANVANLLLARGCHREPEMAVRTALGATGARLVRQTLTESLVLAVAGGLLGLAVAWWGIALLRYLAADLLPGPVTPRLDVRVLTFAMVVTAMTGLLFGSLPALRAKHTRVNDTLKDGGRGATAGGRRRTQSALIVAEVALTAVLLSTAGLLLRSLVNTAAVDPGFEPARVLAFDVTLPNVTYDTNEKRLAFTSALLERLRSLPGVEAAGAGRAVPFSDGGSGEYFRRAGLPVDQAERSFVLGRLDFVSPGYLEALGAHWRAGRAIEEADNRLGAPRVVILNDTAARTIFPEGQAVGQRIAIAAQSWLVIGVVADLAQQRLDAPQRLFAWVPQAFNTGLASIAVRTRQSPGALIAPVREEVRRLDAGVAIANPRALDRAMSASMTARRMVLMVVGAFAVTAVGLASIGLYGVMSYSIATRRRELSIRLALGAVHSDVVRAVLRDGLRLVSVGLAAGLAASWGAGRLLASELYQVSGHDPWVAAGTTIILLSVAAIACWAPARAATRVNPIAALRNER